MLFFFRVLSLILSLVSAYPYKVDRIDGIHFIANMHRS